MEFKGLIQDIKTETGTSKAGKPYKRFVFIIDEKKYSTFDEKWPTEFKAGDFVKVEGEMKNGYFNMINIAKVENEVVETVRMNTDTKLGVVPSDANIRLKCLEYAISDGMKPNEILQLADLFFHYIKEGNKE